MLKAEKMHKHDFGRSVLWRLYIGKRQDNEERGCNRQKQVRQSITVLDKSDFVEIRQTQELNEMQQIGIKCGEFNEITGNFEMERGDYLYQIIDYDATKKLRTSTQ